MYIWILCCHLPLNIYGFVWILKTWQEIGKRFVVLSLGATMMAIPVAIFSSWNLTKIQRNTTPFYCALCSDMCTPILNLTFHCQKVIVNPMICVQNWVLFKLGGTSADATINAEYILYITIWYSVFPAKGDEEAHSLWFYWFSER